MQRNNAFFFVANEFCVKVHFTNSCRVGSREEGGEVTKIPYDWCPANWSRQRRSGNRNRSQAEKMTFRQTWSSANSSFSLIWPKFFRDFISSIALYKPEENEDEKKKAKKDEKKVEKPVKKQVKFKEKVVKAHFYLFCSFQQHQFTELEVMTLWNSFKIDFPEDKINKIQLNELVAQLFPK